jgi:hypothetical protein
MRLNTWGMFLGGREFMGHSFGVLHCDLARKPGVSPLRNGCLAAKLDPSESNPFSSELETPSSPTTASPILTPKRLVGKGWKSLERSHDSTSAGPHTLIVRSGICSSTVSSRSFQEQFHLLSILRPQKRATKKFFDINGNDIRVRLVHADDLRLTQKPEVQML